MPDVAERSNGKSGEEARSEHSGTEPIFTEDGQQLRIYVPPDMEAGLRARVCEEIQRHGGKVKRSKVERSNVVLFDLDDGKESRLTYRLARAQVPPIRVVPVSWIFDSVAAGEMRDAEEPRYNPIARLEEYEKKKKAAAGSAALSSALQERPPAAAPKRVTSTFGRTPYDHIDRKHIVELLASKPKPWSGLAIAKELFERHGRHSAMSYQTRLRDHLDKGDNYAARVKAYLQEQRQREELDQLQFLEDEAEDSDAMSTPPRDDVDDKAGRASATKASTEVHGGAAASGSRSMPAAKAPAADVASAAKPKFTPPEREALAHKLVGLLKGGRAKGQDQELIPPETFWKSLAEELPSHSAAEWYAHHAKNAAMYLEMARLTLRLEATQTQPMHAGDSEDEEDDGAAVTGDAAAPEAQARNEPRPDAATRDSSHEAADIAHAKRRRLAEETAAAPSPSVARPPSRSPPSNSIAVQQEMARKKYLREVTALRDEFGFTVVSQISPYLRDGDTKAGRRKLNALIEGYEEEYALRREDVINAIRRASGRLEDAKALMENSRRM